MIRKNGKILIIALSAFVAAISFLFFKKQNGDQSGEGRSRFKVETIQGENGWGYLIREDTAAVIEQKVIPGVPGLNGFKTEEQAAKTAGLVKRKLDHGIFPPTISVAELDSMGISYK